MIYLNNVLKYEASKYNLTKQTNATKMNIFICSVCHQTIKPTTDRRCLLKPSIRLRHPLFLSLCLPFSVILSLFLLFPPPPQLSFLSLSRRRSATESVLRQIDVLWIGYPVCYSKCWYTAFQTPSSFYCGSTAPIDK